MATAGLCEMFRNIRVGLKDPGAAGSPAQATAKNKKPRKKRRPKKTTTESSSTHRFPKRTPACTENHMQRMPPEILIKILSYLDASSLFCIGLVNKKFYQLANNNTMWHKMYLSAFGRSKKWTPRGVGGELELQRQSSVEAQEKPEGFWRRLHFRTMAGYDERKWKRELKEVNPYTGLPFKTERVLRDLRVTWEITVCDRSNSPECVLESSHAYYCESSVTVCWSSSRWPFYHVSNLQVHGVMKVALNCPRLNNPGWESLMAKFDMNEIDAGQVIGSDKLVNLVLLSPGILLGVWRGKRSVAFAMVNFHFHRLVERSLLGSSVCPYSMPEDKPPFDDVDSHYGLHDYTLHIVLHNTVTKIMSGHWTQLFCRKGDIRDGHIHLTAISRCHLYQHTPLSGKINLPWRSEVLQGTVENCCMMSVTLLDEYRNLFWGVSTPVTMEPANEQPVSYDYEGESFLIRYQDAEGRVKMELVWLEELGQYFLVSLVVSVALGKINRHFGTDY